MTGMGRLKAAPTYGGFGRGRLQAILRHGFHKHGFRRHGLRGARLQAIRRHGFRTHGLRGGRLQAALLALIVISTTSLSALRVETLRSVAALPPHIVGQFEEPASFVQAATGIYYVFDRRGHRVYTIGPDMAGVRKAVDIGQERGRILLPVGFDVAADGSFAVADVPGRQRVQLFDVGGSLRGGFFLPGQPTALVSIGNVTLNGLASIRLAGDRLLMSHPESGSLFTVYSLTGYPWRSFGRLRETGFEQDRDVHNAMNAGVPLVDPHGGYYFVFLAGRPAFQKYDAAGRLLFERHIEGVELDTFVAALPTRWPTRRIDNRELPLVTPTIRTAAVDAHGQLWISLTVPFTYVYDASGDKIRTIQFMAAGPVAPTSLSFSPSGRLLVTPGCFEFDPGGSADRRDGAGPALRTP